MSTDPQKIKEDYKNYVAGELEKRSLRKEKSAIVELLDEGKHREAHVMVYDLWEKHAIPHDEEIIGPFFAEFVW